MAGQQRHVIEFADIPGTHEDAARVGVRAQVVDHARNLVDVPAARRRPRAPLLAVHRAELAGRIGPFVPDGDAVLAQPRHVRIAAQEPQQLVHDRFQVHAFRGHERKAAREVEAHLAAEERTRARPRAVGLQRPFVADAPQQLEIGKHVKG